MHYSTKIFTIIMALQMIVGAVPVNAIGMSPSEFVIPAILNGVPQTRRMTLMRSKGETGDLHFTTQLNGEYAHHIDVPKEIILPADQERIDTDVTVHPENAPSGFYSVMLTYLLDTQKNNSTSGGASVSIRQGMAVNIKYTVSGDTVINTEIRSVDARDTEVGSPISFTFIAQNNGNVEWMPQRVDVVFNDKFNPESIVTSSAGPENFSPLNPGEQQPMSFSVEADLIESVYTADLIVISQDKEVGRYKTEEFEVFQEGTFSQSGSFVSLSASNTTHNIGDKIKIDGVFKNTGAVGIKAVMSSELFINDEFKDILKSEELSFATGQERTFTHLINATESGNYRIKSKISFGNQESQIKHVDISVVSPLSSSSFLNILVLIAVLTTIIFVIIVMVLVVRNKRRTANKNTEYKAPQQVIQPTETIQPNTINKNAQL